MRPIQGLLGSNIRALRTARGWTQADLAEHADLSTNFIAQIERQETWPYPDTITKIARALGATEDRLFASIHQKPSTAEAWEVITEKLGLEGSLGAIKRRLKALDSDHEKNPK